MVWGSRPLMTYLNVITYQMKKNVEIGRVVEAGGLGEDLCQNVHCKYGARCENGQCVCPVNCPDNYEPVCVTDGSTYPNECEMRREACIRSQDLSVLFYGECGDVGSSGQEYRNCQSPGKISIKCWHEKYKRVGNVLHRKDVGRPSASDEVVDKVRETLAP
ncbi:hypothetical protein AVEN_109884-1 [Araneus ventricosus]|uniref:Kazal-like domain-containing protein n=1 Tax=Araneus ventricosus TaxID=182803 RepID=A0A4Y2T4I2_ARAVE|nr:hypothetical protein AVEN_109884-1 [Araneus ventricosus]